MVCVEIFNLMHHKSSFFSISLPTNKEIFSPGPLSLQSFFSKRDSLCLIKYSLHQNIFTASVVLFETDNLCSRIISLEVEDVTNVGPAPSINGLVGIAHDADVPVVADQKARHHILGVVCILIIVNQQVGPSILRFAKRQDAFETVEP